MRYAESHSGQNPDRDMTERLSNLRHSETRRFSQPDRQQRVDLCHRRVEFESRQVIDASRTMTSAGFTAQARQRTYVGFEAFVTRG